MEDQKDALLILEDYRQVGAVKEVSLSGTQFLVPWFIVRKPEGDGIKSRLIADCRQLNQFLETKHFKLDHWKQIFPALRKGMWACKVDLKHAYFHLGLAQALRPFVRLNVGERIFEFQAACFGLNQLPQLWMSVMKVFQKIWRQRGILCFIYLDDILVVGQTFHQTQSSIQFVLETLEASGMVVNKGKSTLVPCQSVQHLGFQINFQEGTLQVPPEKLKSVRRELGKLVTHPLLSCRKMAAILGQVRSFLTAMPFLRAFTDSMLAFVNQNLWEGWDRALAVPPTLAHEVTLLKDLMLHWQGRKFQGSCAVRQLHSDSSDYMWAGLDIKSGIHVQDFWRERTLHHINVKELSAAIATVKSLSKPGEKVSLAVDNSVAFSYLHKGGGKLSHLNHYMRDLWQWCMERNILLEVKLVKSAEDQADCFTRQGLDRDDCTLDRGLFLHLSTLLSRWVVPTLDMFSSPGNKQLDHFVSRHPHWEASLVDALHCPLDQVHHCYANPPWTIIQQWLIRLWENPHLVCMTIVPYWVSAVWWPLLLKLQVPGCKAVIVPPFQGMFLNCWGEPLPPPRWPLLCVVLSGRCFREGKFRLRASKLT